MKCCHEICEFLCNDENDIMICKSYLQLCRKYILLFTTSNSHGNSNSRAYSELIPRTLYCVHICCESVRKSIKKINFRKARETVPFI